MCKDLIVYLSVVFLIFERFQATIKQRWHRNDNFVILKLDILRRGVILGLRVSVNIKVETALILFEFMHYGSGSIGFQN